jgi:GH15 family glucan-1,4-alpha-glucosidase
MRIEDYALIGDTQTAALVSRASSIDWACLPRFDSGACFAALLGDRDNGRWQIRPADPEAAATRRYVEGTLVLETTWTTRTGSARVTDLMPVRGDAPDIVRVVDGISGHVDMSSDLVVRFDYGAYVPWVRRIDGGIQAIAGPDAIELRTTAPLRGQERSTRSDFTVRAHDQVPFVMTWHPSPQPPPEPVDGIAALRATIDWWRQWSSRCTSPAQQDPLVLRSLLTLKALTTRRPGVSSPLPPHRCQKTSEAGATGTTGTAGYETRPSACTP